MRLASTHYACYNAFYMYVQCTAKCNYNTMYNGQLETTMYIAVNTYGVMQLHK